MSLWSNTDANTSVPKFAPSTVKLQNTQSNVDVIYDNTQMSLVQTNKGVGIFGVDATEQGVAANPKGGHAGWNLVTLGAGPIVSITANSGAYSPDGNVYLSFSGGGKGTLAANAQISVNATSKLILAINVLTPGLYTSAPSATATNANASFTITMGGRAGRVHRETLVAMGSMTSDGNDDTIFADS
jgi:hypothetical protein